MTLRALERGAAALCCLAVTGIARADPRSDADVFGNGASAPPSEPAAASATPAASSSAAAGRDASILGAAATPMFNEPAAPEDPLQIGGQLYLRAQVTGSRGQSPGQWAFSSPSLLDVFLDARPNDRVRGFVLARMQYDPTLATSAPSGTSNNALSATGSSSGSEALSSLFQQQTRSPVLGLDQLWIRFDIAHTLFVTAGRQHVRWGTGHLWTPTDYLHLNRRQPLDVFDARPGTTMLKLHLPIQSNAWNLYGYLLTESATATDTLGHIAAAARAECVFGPTELGLGVISDAHHKAKLAADFSAGIGDLDVYGELGLRDSGELDRVRYEPDAPAPTPVRAPSWQSPSDAALQAFEQAVDASYPVYRDNGYKPQLVAGLSYARKYNDNDMFTVGGEYFYNALGYDSPSAYPGLVLPHSRALTDPATFFYLGRQYAAVYLTLPAPYSLDNHTFTLSTLANLSDRSFISRFDYSLVALTHLRFDAFVSARYGNENGEFRFGVQHLNIGGVDFSRAPAVLDFGVALRVAL